MGNHKKSNSWSALSSFPSFLTPSSSTKTQSTARTTTGKFFAPSGQASASLRPFVSSSTQYPGAVSAVSAAPAPAPPSEAPISGSETASARTSSVAATTTPSTTTTTTTATTTATTTTTTSGGSDGGQQQDDNGYPLPSFYLFSSDALANERADETEIIPFVHPQQFALDKASLLAGILESLVQVVDDLPGHTTRSSSCSSASTTSTFSSFASDDLHKRLGTDLLIDDDRDDRNTHHSGHHDRRNHHNRQLSISHDDDEDETLIQGPWSPVTSSMPLDDHPLTSSLSDPPLVAPIPQEHIPPPPTQSPSLTILGLTTFKAILWPSALTEIGMKSDLSLVMIVPATHADQDITDILTRWKKEMISNASVLQAPPSIDYIGNQLLTLIKCEFSIP
ncbi:hypothetical protein BC940DRAFT_300271 [Gongronella butleri]|nr:hypothetical protein BC940DRAFT_300271 [Gongronella butleri]